MRIFQAMMMCLVVGTPALAGWNSMGKINATPPLLNEKFGCSAAVDGNWMAIGASDSTIGGARNTGAVHLFKNDNGTWVYKQSLFQENPLLFQAFGNAVALRGNTLAVGSWGSSSFAGRVFVFTRDSNEIWSLTATLAAADQQPSKPALFGWSVSMDTPANAPPVIAVGRPNDTSLSTGAVYLFEFANEAWTQVAKLTSPTPKSGDQVGTNVSVCNGTVSSGISRRRRAVIFQRMEGVWNSGIEIQESGGTTGDSFGSATSSGGNFVAVGSPNRASSDGVTKTGAVTIFEFDASNNLWKQTTTLTLASPRSGDNFGYAIAAAPTGPNNQPLIAIGAPGYDLPNTDSGAAFAFSKTNTSWQRNSTDLWSDRTIQGQFAGKAMAISRDGLLAVLSTELPRGSIGGVFPMNYLADNSGSDGTRTDTTTDAAGGTSGGTSSGSSGGASSGASGGGDTGGVGTNPTDSFGQGGRPRPLQPLPALTAGFGNVTDTVVVDTGATHSVIGLQMDGVQRFAGPEVQVLATYPDNWTLAATGDLNGDGSGDFIWQDDARNIRVWIRDGTTYKAKNTLRALAANENVVASVDFDGDGVDDIVTRDLDTQTLKVIRMRDGIASGTEYSVPLPSLKWNAVPHRLTSGLLIRNRETGEVQRVTRNLLTGVITIADAPSPDADTVIEGIGDVDGDGNDDMVCRNPSTGEISIWRLNSKGALIASRDTGLDGRTWKVEAVRDWDGNGCDDLLVSRGGSGKLVVLYMHFEGGICKILKSRLIGNVGGAQVIDVTRR